MGPQELGRGTSLVVQWLGLHASTAGGTGSIPGRGTRIPCAVRCSPKKKKEELGRNTWASEGSAVQTGQRS